MKYQVFYMKPEYFREFICGEMTPTIAKLAETHTFLREVEAPNLEQVFFIQQAECWSPNGEARDLIISKGLRHTSMSIGDVATDGTRFWAVAVFGFKEIL